MAQLTQEQVDWIAAKLARRVAEAPVTTQSVSTAHGGIEVAETLGLGSFATIELAVAAAAKAQAQLDSMSLSKRDDIIASIRRKMLDHNDDLARRAHSETGLGRVSDKLIKNKLVIEKTPGTEILKPWAKTGDHGLTLMEWAPYGVIGSITPCTNPTSTIICNTIGMLAAGNAVVFNVHPSARQVSIYNVELLNQAIVEADGPPNLVTTITEPTIASAQELMQHPGIRLLVVTGGAAVVKAAMTSGKRAVCAGPGNPPVVVDETADIEKAARSIVQGASMDNNLICILEKEIFVVEAVAPQLLSALLRYDAYVLKEHQVKELEAIIFAEMRGPRQSAVMNKELIGKNVQEILAKIGLKVDEHIRLAVAPVEQHHPLVWTEQMMPIIPFVTMPDVDQAIDLAREAEHGYGHTAVMHSRNLDSLSRMARVMNCSIFVKNGPSLAGLGYNGEGYCSFSIASPTGEGITNPLSFSRERRCVLVDHFRIV